MLKLLHVIPSIAPKSGGPAGAVIAYANLSTSFAEVTILTTREDLGDQSVESLRKETGLSKSVNLEVFPHLGRHSAKYSRAMLRWMNQHLSSFDVVHLHAAFSVMTSLSARKCRKFGVPYVFRPLGTLTGYSLGAGHSKLKQMYWRMFESRSVAKAGGIHVTSPAEKSAVQQLTGHTNISVIPIPMKAPNSLNPDKNNTTDNDTLQFGFLSRIHPKKNLESLFKALADAEIHQKWHLRIAGDGDQNYINELQSLARQLRIHDRISWEGFLSGDDKTRFFRSVDFFLLPSFDENFGIAAGEALSHGVPAILSDQVDIGSWGDQLCGVIICKTGPESIREALRTAGSWSADEREAKGRKAREMITSSFNPETITHQLREFYTTL